MSTVGSETEENPLSHITYSCVTDVGMRREENQDSYGVIETDRYKFYIVADGMGGVQGGAIASALAVDVVKAFLADKTNLTVGELNGAIGAANHAIFERGMAEPSLAGMGTTFVGLCFTKGRLLVLNVGDSRAYLIRDKSIGQLTEDHTLISELLKSGAITEDQVANHPVAHMLTRSLGPTEEIEIDCAPVNDAPAPGDKFVLCSDGLYNHVTAEEIGEIVSSFPVDKATERLVALANERGGSDNITVMVVEIGLDYQTSVDETEDTMELFGYPGVDFSDGGESLSTEGQNGNGEHAEPDELDTLEELPAINGSAFNGASAMDSPEIAPTVGGVSQERLLKKAMEQAGKIADTETGVGQPAATGSKLKSYLFVIVCVALGTFGSLYWYMRQPSQQIRITKKVPSVAVETEAASVPAVDESVFTSTENAPEEVVVEDEPVLETQENEKPEDSEPAQAEEETEAVVESEDGASPAVEVAVQPENTEPPAILSKMDRIRQQLRDLEAQEELISRRIESFAQPLSGSTGVLLAKASRSMDDLKHESESVLGELEEATKKLSIWYGQKQRLQSTQALKIASEVAVLAPDVAEQKKRFEDVTWQFLKKREELQFKPEDQALKTAVDELVERRKEELKTLNQIVREAVAREMDALDRTIADLTLQKEELDRRTIAASEELEYVQALMSQDPKKQAASKARLSEQLEEVRNEKQSLQQLFSSLYDEITALEPEAPQ